jgi:hypothetical protein
MEDSNETLSPQAQQAQWDAEAETMDNEMGEIISPKLGIRSLDLMGYARVGDIIPCDGFRLRVQKVLQRGRLVVRVLPA